MIPVNNKIILQEISEKKQINGVIIPKQIAANQIIFAKIISLPETEINTSELHEGQYVILGWSPIWNKKYKHKYEGQDYLFVDEFSILATIPNEYVEDLIEI